MLHHWSGSIGPRPAHRTPYYPPTAHGPGALFNPSTSPPPLPPPAPWGGDDKGGGGVFHKDQGNIRKGRGSGTQKLVVVSGGIRKGWEFPPPPLVYGHSDTSLRPPSSVCLHTALHSRAQQATLADGKGHRSATEGPTCCRVPSMVSEGAELNSSVRLSDRGSVRRGRVLTCRPPEHQRHSRDVSCTMRTTSCPMVRAMT